MLKQQNRENSNNEIENEKGFRDHNLSYAIMMTPYNNGEFMLYS